MELCTKITDWSFLRFCTSCRVKKLIITHSYTICLTNTVYGIGMQGYSAVSRDTLLETLRLTFTPNG